MPAMRCPTWDVFCRVVDNFGDMGVCWRLAADLAQRGLSVRLWADDASALRWMAPLGAKGVEVMTWPVDASAAVPGDMPGDGSGDVPGNVVVEAFGCTLPDDFRHRMEAAARPPVWIELAYLSAEDYVERSHGLWAAQPVATATATGTSGKVRKRFFYPGFTTRTGGLLREPDLEHRQQDFEAADWLASQGLGRRADERIVGLFCYEQTALPALLCDLAAQPTLLLATAGHATRQVDTLVRDAPAVERSQARQRQPPQQPQLQRLRIAHLPLLAQPDFDHLLWASDVNFVRGEDSFVRAQWAGRPFVWQIYPQDDGAHLVKLEAFLDRFTADAEAPLARTIRNFWRAWNGNATSLPAWPEQAAWAALCRRWRAGLMAQEDLTSQLIRFAAGSR